MSGSSRPIVGHVAWGQERGTDMGDHDGEETTEDGGGEPTCDDETLCHDGGSA